MSDLVAFWHLGFRHIVGPGALDHILFLLALAALYRPRDWRAALWVVSAFTIGHSLTLALAVTGALRLDTRLVEFLIPLTIVATSAGNIAARARAAAPARGRWQPLLAGAFGLVHGAGFASYLRSLFMERIAVPLLGFNLGIEAGQIVVLGVAALALAAMDRAIESARLPAATSPLRLRAIAVSSVIAIVAARWAVERAPW